MQKEIAINGETELQTKNHIQTGLKTRLKKTQHRNAKQNEKSRIRLNHTNKNNKLNRICRWKQKTN